MFKAVIFDLDGTLLDTLPSLAHSCNTVLMDLGHPTHEQDAYRQMVGRGISHLVWQMLPEAVREAQHSEALEQYHDTYDQNLYYELTPYPGIPELLQNLAARNIKLAVLSNKAQTYSEELVENIFPGIFDCVVGAGAKYPLKPDPASATAIAEYFRLENSEILFVGDSNVDMMTAKNAEMTACGVAWGFRSREELLEAGADYIIEQAEEILDLVSG
ncbi:MAG: HAD family hydrolase [Eubacteriales bacterium]|nr:HAD family hydrolase [Eubacteriales bacterium]MDD4323496.1 HAD family hydrolase [Eubacteriales bacterium]MDD4541381.1 HAD family hydrolase [Eubacteriales bacterium]